MEETNQRYAIKNMPLEGVISEIGDKISYKNCTGFLRVITLRVKGVYDTIAYVPLTLFGRDAESLEAPRDIGRTMKCTGRLSSRRYEDSRGKMRLSLSMTAADVEFGPHPPANELDVPAEDENKPSVTADDSFMADNEDLPF